MRNGTTTIATRIPANLLDDIKQILAEDNYLNVSDYLRQLIHFDIRQHHEEKTKKEGKKDDASVQS
jgi:Arc/MetJ-type ribon-helix-helix transcriptional regulator